jgi:DNA-directed RNA polymerase specialized sigma24 family protein
MDSRIDTPCPPPRDSLSLAFNKYLEDYQSDIKKIVGKHRYPNHHLSAEELVSEVNMTLLSKKDNFLDDFKGEFTYSNFKKRAYSFIRNCIKWKHCDASRSDYIGKRVDLQHGTEEGTKTTFDLALSMCGDGEDFYEDFDRNTKYSFLLKMVKEYSSLLTDKEAKVLSFLEKGLNRYKIADNLGVTPQAISLLAINVADKIKAHLGKDALKDTSYKEVSKGRASIEDFFKIDPRNSPMSAEDRPFLKKFLFDNARAYTSLEASKVFLNGKYSNRQIAAFAIKNKLSFCLILKRTGYKFSAKETEKILSLFKKGLSSKRAASLMGIPLASIRGKKGSLVKAGLL